MEDENLLEMLEFAVSKAVRKLEKKEELNPFAYALDKNNHVIAFRSDNDDKAKAYEELTQKLRKSAQEGNIRAVVLLQDAPIPASFNIKGEQSIRVHVEHSDNIDEKIAARFLYIPYYVVSIEDNTFDIRLAKPEPVAFPHEIFVK